MCDFKNLYVKNLLIIIFLLLFIPNVFSQRVAIANDKMNVFYKGVDNPLTIVVENVPCSKLIVNSECGDIKMISDSCHYVFMADSTCQTETKIKVGINENGTANWIGSKFFRIKRIPDPEAYIANQKGGSMNKGLILASGGIITRMTNFDFDIFFRITNYSFLIQKNDSTMFIKLNNNGNKYTPEIMDAIYRTEKGDMCLFFNIIAVGPDKEKRTLNTIELIIK